VKPVKKVKPVYPPQAEQQHIQGSVKVRLNTDVKKISREKNKWNIQFADEHTEEADFICVASGGYPKAMMFDWVAETGHSKRLEDLNLVASLGIKTLRYPALWEHVEAVAGKDDWGWLDQR